VILLQACLACTAVCRVAFVLLEDFEQDDPQGITDALEAGVQEGQ